MARPNISQLVAESPLPQMVQQLGNSVAEAQYAMDKTALSIARLMADKTDHGVQLGDENSRQYSLLELGFTPSFYQMTNVTIEARIALSMAVSQEISVGASIGVSYMFFAASVNASYSNKFSYEASASSSIAAQLAAIPAPAPLQELLQAQVKEQQTDTPD